MRDELDNVIKSGIKIKILGELKNLLKLRDILKPRLRQKKIEK